MADNNELVYIKENSFGFVELQPRSLDEYEEKHPAMQELILSIKEHGLAQFPLAIPDPSGEHQYLIVAGRRRTTACMDFLGYKEMPCSFRDISLEEAMIISFEENAVRSDVHTIDNAIYLYKAAAQFGEAAVLSMGKELGKRAIRQYLKIGKLMSLLSPAQIKKLKRSIKTFTELRVIEGVKPADDKKILMQRIEAKLTQQSEKKKAAPKAKPVEVGGVSITTNIGPRSTTINLKCKPETGEEIVRIIHQHLEDPSPKKSLIARLFRL